MVGPDRAPRILADALEPRVARLWTVLSRGASRELSRTATSALAALRDRGPRRITELAGSEAVAQPTMTSLVGRLERDGLVERRDDPADRRAVQVAITPAGLTTLRRLGDARAALLAERLAALSPDEQAAIAAALPALDALTAETEEPR